MTTLGIHDILMQAGDQKPGYQLEWPNRGSLMFFKIDTTMNVLLDSHVCMHYIAHRAGKNASLL